MKSTLASLLTAFTLSGCVTYFGSGSPPNKIPDDKKNNGIYMNVRIENAQLYKDHTPTEALLLTGVAICSYLDYASTVKGLERGFEEGNPVLGEKPKKEELILAKLGGFLVSYVAGQFLSDYRKEIYGFSMGVYCGAAVWNTYLLNKESN